jgi:hypothetical protein
MDDYFYALQNVHPTRNAKMPEEHGKCIAGELILDIHFPVQIVQQLSHLSSSKPTAIEARAVQ